MKKHLFFKILEGQRIAPHEIDELFKSSDFHSLGNLAHQVQNKKSNLKKIVTYIVDRNINYTNVCISRCQFCAFYKEKDAEDAYLLPYEKISKKIKETLTHGGNQILLQGGLHPDLTIDYYESLLGQIKNDFNIHIHGLSPPEVVHISKNSNLPVKTVIERLNKAGLDSIPGGGAEVLDDDVRKMISPQKCNAQDWLNVMETAHQIGLRTTATMMFGHLEKPSNIINHLLRIRQLQDKTGGFTAFIPWPFQSGNTQMEKFSTTAYEYLKILAISRIVLDNIPNIQASWVTQGAKISQLSLLFGANDMGSTMLEENVVKAAGVSHKMTEKEIRRLIINLGFIPQRRNMFYEFVS